MPTRKRSIDPSNGQSGATNSSQTNNQSIWPDWFTSCLHWLQNPLSTILIGIGWLVNLFSVIIIGAGIGWLLGLSVAPVVASIIAVVIAAAATLVAVMGGWEKNEDKANKSKNSGSENGGEDVAASTNDASTQEINVQRDQQQTILTRFTRVITPLPFALLMVGIVGGSIVGLYARNHSWFGSSLSYEVEKWTAQGLPKDEVVRRLFEREHPYTPYIQPWLRITSTSPISSSASITMPSITVTDPFSAEIQVWVNAGLDAKEVVTRLFSLKYPPYTKSQLSMPDQSPSESNNAQSPVSQFNSVFYQLTKEQCGMLRRGIIESSYLPIALQAVNLGALLRVKDPEELQGVVEKLLQDSSCPD